MTRKATRPLTWEAIKRWLDWQDSVGFNAHWKKARIDERLITIAPALAGMIEQAVGYLHADVPASSRKRALAVAKRSIGTTTVDSWNVRDSRVKVVSDWMVRYAIPLWLDCSPRYIERAKQLRALTPLLWQAQIVEAVYQLSAVQIALGRQRQYGTEHDRVIYEECYHVTSSALGVLTHVLGLALTGEAGGSFPADRDHVTWISRRAIASVISATGPAAVNETIQGSLAELERVVRETSEGDSLDIVAARCAWQPARRSGWAA